MVSIFLRANIRHRLLCVSECWCVYTRSLIQLQIKSHLGKYSLNLLDKYNNVAQSWGFPGKCGALLHVVTVYFKQVPNTPERGRVRASGWCSDGTRSVCGASGLSSDICLEHSFLPQPCACPLHILPDLQSPPQGRAGLSLLSASRLGHLQSQRRVLGLRHFKDSGTKMKSVLIDGLECNLIPKMLTHL